MRNVEACITCIMWFGLNEVPGNRVVIVYPGNHCRYCTDLTGRPNYAPRYNTILDTLSPT
jgi:hypothetical protein